MYWAGTGENPEVLFSYKRKMRNQEILTLVEFVDIKGWKAIGNKIEDIPLVKVESYQQTKNPPSKIENRRYLEFDF